MAKAVVFFAEGTEECEALLVVDLLRRAKVEISLCGEPKTLTLSVEGDGSEEAGSS